MNSETRTGRNPNVIDQLPSMALTPPAPVSHSLPEKAQKSIKRDEIKARLKPEELGE
jgi:hypothetical protein